MIGRTYELMDTSNLSIWATSEMGPSSLIFHEFFSSIAWVLDNNSTAPSRLHVSMQAQLLNSRKPTGLPSRMKPQQVRKGVAPCKTAKQSATTQEPETAEEADERQTGRRPEQSAEEAGRTRVGLVREAELVDVVAGDGDGEERVGEDPQRDEARAEGLVRVLERLLGVFLRRVVGRKSTLDRRFERLVDVCLRDVDFFDHSRFTVGRLLCLRRWECIGFIRAFGSPGHVVPIAEGIDHEDVDVGCRHEEVLRKGGEHVPRIEVEERGHEVETKCRGKCNDDDTRATGCEEGFDEFVYAIINVDVGGVLRGERPNDKIEGIHDDIELNQGKHHKGCDVGVSASLRSVAKRQDKLQQQEGQIYVFDDGVENGSDSVTERKGAIAVSRRRYPYQIDDDGSGEVVRCWIWSIICNMSIGDS
nr:hypothetical protein CFP56_21087 [Quercus suber]